MSGSDFFGLMRHPKWQQKRLEVLSEFNFQCNHCDETELELHVHHKVYRAKAKPWEYDMSELACLCLDCHKKETERVREIKEILFLHVGFDDVDLVVSAISPYIPKYLDQEASKEMLMRAEVIQKCLRLYGQDMMHLDSLVSEILVQRSKRRNIA